jgi:hypothetical protein
MVHAILRMTKRSGMRLFLGLNVLFRSLTPLRSLFPLLLAGALFGT